MIKKLRLATILGTRPEIIRLSEIIKQCDRYFDHTLIHTGQNYDYELNKLFFEDLELRSPEYMLNAVGDNLGETIGTIIAKSYELLMDLKPDALMVLGDTNSALSAIAAKRLKIPIFHLEAGNRCFDENLPEETNRRIVDHIADVNLCYSEHARRYLLSEGLPKERIFVIGSPMAEVLSAHQGKIESSCVLQRLELEKRGYILLSAHREENIDDQTHFFSLMNAVNAMAETYACPVIYSVHPRSSKAIKDRGFHFHENVRSLSPFSFSDYNCLQIHAKCVVSDSGTLPEESAYFANCGRAFPAVSIRTSTERSEAFEKGCFILGGITEESVLRSVDMAIAMCRKGFLSSPVPDYTQENVSSITARIIQSYTDIVNRNVWRK